MERMVDILVDGQPVRVKENTALLQSLRQAGYAVPGLCYSSFSGGSGSCGLCLVEILTGEEWQLRHSCLLNPRQGLSIKTKSPRLIQVRAQAARLLLARGPFRNKEVNELLRDLVRAAPADGEPLPAETARYPAAGCILCGLCVRACQELGRHRLTFVGRGKNLRVALVADNGDSCGSCQACRRLCPTGYLTPGARPAKG